MSDRPAEERVSPATAARALGGLPLDAAERRYLDEIATVSRQAVAALYAIEGIRYAEPAVVFRLDRCGRDEKERFGAGRPDGSVV